MAPQTDPFRSELVDGILTLTLDTPGCDYNIFSRQAADQLVDLLGEVDSARVRAVVLRSAKSKSFVNGVGLMLANAVREAADIVPLTASIRRAYEALGNLRVPTIAAIRGNCFGCGVELTLRCDYRVADDRYDTQFYMTEVADYLFIPCFGGTQRLPRLLGLEEATRFLLWGRRRDAREARRIGLVDEVFEPDGFEASLSAFVGEVTAGVHAARSRRPPSDPDSVTAFVERTEAEIGMLPATYQPVYRQCFELLADAASAKVPIEIGDERELMASGRTVITSESKAAQSFFFVRQVAEGLAIRGAPEVESIAVTLVDLPELQAELDRRRLRDVHTLPKGTASLGAAVRLGPVQNEADGRPRGTEEPCDAEVALGKARSTATGLAPLSICIPSLQGEIRAAEVAVRDPMLASRAAAIADLLRRAGWVPVVSHRERGFAVDALLDAYFLPLARHLDRGGTAAELSATLRDFGFIHGPSRLLRLFPQRDGAERLTDGCAENADAVPEVADALLLSLLAFTLEAHLKKWLAHPSSVDILAREVLDFPLSRGSLCRYLTPARVAQLLERSSALGTLAGAEAVERARGYVEAGRSFYR